VTKFVVNLNKFNCQGYKVEISNRQLTVEFVNQPGILTPTPCESNIRSETADYAEHLGLANSRYRAVASDTAQSIKRLEMQQLHWNEYLRCAGELQKWFGEQEFKLKSFEQAHHPVSIKEALKDCQVSIIDSMILKKSLS